MSEKILTLHPQNKQGVNIDRGKYDEIRGAILEAIGENEGITFGELTTAVGEKCPNFDGSIGWYTTSVKLDLEARGLIERIPKLSPQQLRLSK